MEAFKEEINQILKEVIIENMETTKKFALFVLKESGGIPTKIDVDKLFNKFLKNENT